MGGGSDERKNYGGLQDRCVKKGKGQKDKICVVEDFKNVGYVNNMGEGGGGRC